MKVVTISSVEEIPVASLI